MPQLKTIDRRDFQTRVASRGMSLCIAQLHRERVDIAKNSPSPSNVEVVRQLLQRDNPACLIEHVQRDHVTLLQCPEYAFASIDWQALDRLVRGYPEALILCAGFGLAASGDVDAIVACNDVTAGWDEGTPLKQGFRYNFGALWLHSDLQDAGSATPRTHCYLFGKTVAEQAHERECNPYRFSEHLSVELADLTLWPFLCADAVNRQDAGGVSTAVRNGVCNGISPSLVLGLLRQCSGQDDTRWSEGISALARAKGDGQSTVVIANTAADRIASLERRARNLSGIYAAFGKGAARSRPGQTIRSHHEGLDAWLLRTAEASVVLGTLHMGSHAADTTLHHFFPDHAWTVGTDGTLRTEHRKPIGLELSAAADAELLRFGAGDTRATASECIAGTLKKHDASIPCRIDAVAACWLQGPLPAEGSARHTIDADDARYLPELCLCIDAVGGLMNVPDGIPRLEPDFSVTARCDGAFNPAIGTLDDIPVWLWIDPLRDRQAMVSELARRLQEELRQPSAMLVLGRGKQKDFVDRLLSENAGATPITQARTHSSTGDRQDLSNIAPRSAGRKVRLMGIEVLGGLWQRDLREATELQHQHDELEGIHQSLKGS